MKKKSFPMALFFVFAFLSFITVAANATQKPEAVVPEPLFTFEPVLEGDTVSHDFIIKNNGSAPLEIIKTDSD